MRRQRWGWGEERRGEEWEDLEKRGREGGIRKREDKRKMRRN